MQGFRCAPPPAYLLCAPSVLKTIKIMSKTFDIKRFGQLVRHDVRSFPQEGLFAGLWFATLFAPLMVLLQPLLGGSTVGTFYRLTLMVSMIAVYGMMVPMYVYPHVGKKKRGIYFAMLPATKAEKHLSMAIVSMVVAPVVLLVIGLTCDVLFTVVHLPGYHKYFWQAEPWQAVTLPMVVGVALAFVGAVFGAMYANTFQRKGLRYLLSALMWAWLIVGLMALPILFDTNEIGDAYWVVIAAEAAFALLFAWLSRRRMDKMGY